MKWIESVFFEMELPFDSSAVFVLVFSSLFGAWQIWKLGMSVWGVNRYDPSIYMDIISCPVFFDGIFADSNY